MMTTWHEQAFHGERGTRRRGKIMDSLDSQAAINAATDAATERERGRASRQRALAGAVARVQSSVHLGSPPVAQPVFVILSGLPGSGKSVLARRIQPHLPATIVETDHVRRIIFRTPQYSNKENAWVYTVCHALIERLLQESRSVVFDATNLVERNRAVLYGIAERCQARIVIVRTVAPLAVIEQRLQRRSLGLDAMDHSDAGMAVYAMLRETEQPIARPHLVIDTSEDGEQSVRRILCACRE
jgi:predicted kinase